MSRLPNLRAIAPQTTRFVLPAIEVPGEDLNTALKLLAQLVCDCPVDFEKGSPTVSTDGHSDGAITLVRPHVKRLSDLDKLVEPASVIIKRSGDQCVDDRLNDVIKHLPECVKYDYNSHDLELIRCENPAKDARACNKQAESACTRLADTASSATISLKTNAISCQGAEGLCGASALDGLVLALLAAGRARAAQMVSSAQAQLANARVVSEGEAIKLPYVKALRSAAYVEAACDWLGKQSSAPHKESARDNGLPMRPNLRLV